MPRHRVPTSRPTQRARWTWAIAGGALVAVGLAIVLGVSVLPSQRPTPTATASSPTPEPTVQVTSAAPAPIPANWDLDNPDSLTVVVNKQRPLSPTDYVPVDLRDVNVPHTWAPLLRAEAATAVENLFAAAQSEAGLTLASNSAYRSFAAQQSIYKGDDLTTARPGFSEHQTGLAIDIGAASGTCSLSTCFADTAEGSWLAQNAWRFGFVLRYPDGQTAITGYEFEPWHYRYIGVDAAKAYRDASALSLEAFFGLPPAPNY
ncbi:MAG TPA: M15 family metallopeptidase [Microbacteriaceae bacterium]|nr:M15 family metallopeptidase [Microbacteriaceae bacterium]